MRKAAVLAVLLLSFAAVSSQTPERAARAAAVKEAVGTAAGSSKKSAEVILYDLREYNGKIVAMYEEHFVIVPGKKGLPNIEIKIFGKKRPRSGINIRYADVLQFSSKTAALSFVPDPAARPYGDWDAIRGIGTGEFLHVRTKNDASMMAVYLRSTPETLSLMKGNQEVVIPAAEVAAVYRLKGDTRNLATKILNGGSRGKDMDPWLGIGDAMRSGDPVTASVAAITGATVFMLPIGKTSRVLVYSR